MYYYFFVFFFVFNCNFLLCVIVNSIYKLILFLVIYYLMQKLSFSLNLMYYIVKTLKKHSRDTMLAM